MFVSLWNYLKGYVIVEVRGYSLEKFMNLALHTGIYFWDVEHRDGKLFIKTSIKGFKALKPFVQKSRCRIKITKKIGFPFISFRYRKRSMLVMGSFLFIVLLYILTSFVWLVEVEGNSRINEVDIIETLAHKGYTTGKFKNGLDLRQAEADLINQYPEITWAGIKFEGTKLLVQVAETVPKPKMHDETIPCDLITKRDALITYIATKKGMPEVKKGDTVKKGETLVSGKIPLQQDEALSMQYTHSKADIKARTFYALQGEIPLYKVKKNYTQNVSKNFSVKLFNTKIPLYKNKRQYEHSDTLITVDQLRITELFPLPFYLEKEEKVEYIPEMIEVSQEEAMDKLEGALHDKLEETMGKDGKVLDQKIVYKKSGEVLIGELYAVVEENVSEIREITSEEIQQEQETPKGENE
ncbi:MAG: sporulation protein YqfD [Cellulosilyticaceae bacterium]